MHALLDYGQQNYNMEGPESLGYLNLLQYPYLKIRPSYFYTVNYIEIYP